MTLLYFDCFSGAAGDMILGALLDAGVPFDGLQRALGSLSIDDGAVWTERVRRAGVSAVKFCVRGEDGGGDQGVRHAHDHGRHEGRAYASRHDAGHDPGQRLASAAARPSAVVPEHAHRTLAEIYALIDRSALSGASKDRAKHLFARLGEIEADIHGTSMEQVHLHEVGALDSVIDIVGTVHALEVLGADRVVSSPLNVGGGSVRSAHGVLPVPAPATLRLLMGAPIHAGPQAAELVTPTGALLVTEYAAEYGPIPPMRVTSVGYGAGSRDFAETPNVLRVLVGEADSAAASMRVVVIEAEIDDMNPQIFGVLMDRLLGEGALDVFFTPIQMKKNRPGTLLTAIARPAARERLTSTIFRETTTIGVRYREVARECLDRETVSVQTPFGAVRFKMARRHGELLNASPEFEDCARLAADTGKPVKDVQAAAMKAFLDRT